MLHTSRLLCCIAGVTHKLCLCPVPCPCLQVGVPASRSCGHCHRALGVSIPAVAFISKGPPTGMYGTLMRCTRTATNVLTKGRVWLSSAKVSTRSVQDSTQWWHGHSLTKGFLGLPATGVTRCNWAIAPHMIRPRDEPHMCHTHVPDSVLLPLQPAVCPRRCQGIKAAWWHCRSQQQAGQGPQGSAGAWGIE